MIQWKISEGVGNQEKGKENKKIKMKKIILNSSFVRMFAVKSSKHTKLIISFAVNINFERIQKDQ